MINLPEKVTLPIKIDADGILRISGTRVTVDTLIAFYHQGETPED